MFIKHNSYHPLLRFFEKRQAPQNTRPMRAGSERLRRYLSSWREASAATSGSIAKESQPLDEERAFRAVDGTVLYTLVDLHSLLARMEEEHYTHHALGECNDFSCWLRDVWGEEIAADLVLRSRARSEAQAVVERLCRRRGEL
ncbi:MAG: hypothetical protein WD049_06130 [Candidatus Paceibacterota bacterium]